MNSLQYKQCFKHWLVIYIDRGAACSAVTNITVFDTISDISKTEATLSAQGPWNVPQSSAPLCCSG